MIAAGVAAGAATLSGCSSDDVVPSGPPSAGPPQVTVAHQAGVTTFPEACAALVSFDVAGTGLGALFDRLTERVGRIAASGFASVTVAVGASLFDGRFGLAAVRPALLTPMPGFPNDVLEAKFCGGDLLLQVCAEDSERVAAAVADLGRTEGLRQRWRIEGFRAENGRTSGGLPAARNLFGFREGAGNPDPSDGELMDRLVWAVAGEPAWAAGGTYQVVRLIRLATELWNRDPVPHQESIFGRRRADGAPLSGGAEAGAFDYAADPDGLVTPLDAHIRRANPRTPESRQHQILRRSYSYRRAAGGRDDEGLIFICYQRDPENGFAATQRRLAGEALDRYVLPFGGGYFFVPPSVEALRSVVSG